MAISSIKNQYKKSLQYFIFTPENICLFFFPFLSILLNVSLVILCSSRTWKGHDTIHLKNFPTSLGFHNLLPSTPWVSWQLLLDPSFSQPFCFFCIRVHSAHRKSPDILGNLVSPALTKQTWSVRLTCKVSSSSKFKYKELGVWWLTCSSTTWEATAGGPWVQG